MPSNKQYKEQRGNPVLDLHHASHIARNLKRGPKHLVDFPKKKRRKKK